MSTVLHISKGNKEEQYKELLPQLAAILSSEPDTIAQMANFCAIINSTFQHYWIGFYRVIDQQLVLGPFQGTLACTRIDFAKGVCGTAWATAQTQIVPDVNLFEGHIACSSESKSEIVIPIFHQNKVVAVLDLDSLNYNTFDVIDQQYLEQAVSYLTF